jgi:CRP-like cAMP-binding protein
MRGRTTTLTIVLTPDERAELERWQRSTTIGAGYQRRDLIVLFAAAGFPLVEIATLVGIQRHHLYKWLKRFRAQGVPGLYGRSGRPRRLTAVAYRCSI